MLGYYGSNECKVSTMLICLSDIYQGGSFPFAWKSAIKRTLHKASIGQIHRLDRYAVSFKLTF